MHRESNGLESRTNGYSPDERNNSWRMFFVVLKCMFQDIFSFMEITFLWE